MLNIPCIIFAGGKSSRRGEDKALLPFGKSSTLTEYQIKKLQKIFKDVYISCKDKSKFNFEANFIEDITGIQTYAPTVGFASIYEKLPDDRFFVISVDTPFIGLKEIQKLLEYDRNNLDAIVASTASGIQPLCGIYHRSLEKKFLTMIDQNDHKLGYLLKNSKTHYLHFEDDSPFLNLNHPDEYKKALTLI